MFFLLHWLSYDDNLFSLVLIYICSSSYACTVSRVEAVTDDRRTYMQLDVAVEVYPMYEKQRFKMVLADTLSLDGTPDTGYFTQVTNLAIL